MGSSGPDVSFDLRIRAFADEILAIDARRAALKPSTDDGARLDLIIDLLLIVAKQGMR